MPAQPVAPRFSLERMRSIWSNHPSRSTDKTGQFVCQGGVRVWTQLFFRHAAKAWFARQPGRPAGLWSMTRPSSAGMALAPSPTDGRPGVPSGARTPGLHHAAPGLDAPVAAFAAPSPSGAVPEAADGGMGGRRDRNRATVRRRLTATDAWIRLKSLYPSIQ